MIAQVPRGAREASSQGSHVAQTGTGTQAAMFDWSNKAEDAHYPRKMWSAEMVRLTIPVHAIL